MLFLIHHNLVEFLHFPNIFLLQIDLLHFLKYKTISNTIIRPKEKLNFIKKSLGNPILTIKGIKVVAIPSLAYKFEKDGQQCIGAAWFIAKKGGYHIEEVGMYCEMLFRFLKYNYSKEYIIRPKHCIALDVIGGHSIEYSMNEGGRLFSILTPTIEEINSLL